MAKEWDEVALWALAEKLSERMDAIREGGAANASQKQRELRLGPGGNVVDFASHPRVQSGRMRRCGSSTCACNIARTSRTPGAG